MASSTIIYGGNSKDRKDKALELISKYYEKSRTWGDLDKSPDIKILETPKDKKSIGIADIRAEIAYLSEKPFSGRNKVLAINDAHALTNEAQNALLKTLEEPPEYAHIILLTKTLNDLAGTVVSRCKITQIKRLPRAPKENTDAKSNYGYNKLLKLEPGQKLDLAYELSKEEKVDILEIMEEWVAEAREMMLDSPSAVSLSNIKLIDAVKRDIENTNVGVRLALESLLINLD